MERLLRWLKDVLVRRILGLKDTPHRIAWGVLLGCLVAFTPTLGFQIVTYVFIATLLRANKVAGIPILFISNPFTAVPLYLFVWKVGSFFTHGGELPPLSERVQMRQRLADADVPEGTWQRMASLDFWKEVVNTLFALGGELWLGALVLGVSTGIPAYFLVYWGVREYRRRHAPRTSV